MRSLSKLRFRVLGLATVKDISTARFEEIIRILISEGWKPTWRFQGVDAWIDYGCVKLRKRWTKLTFEWDNCSEGSIEGPRATVQVIAQRFGFTASDEWRWAAYDDVGGA